jgi:hypothetical protein
VLVNLKIEGGAARGAVNKEGAGGEDFGEQPEPQILPLARFELFEEPLEFVRYDWILN